MNAEDFNNFDYEKLNLSELQSTVDNWIKENGGYWEPLAMLAAITEEVGEVAREINHLEKIKTKKETEKKKNLDIELGDLLFSIFCLSNHYKINLGEAYGRSMEKYAKRDWKRFVDNKLTK